MLRSFVFLCLMGSLALAQERSPGKGVNFYSIEREIALGKQQAAELLRNTRRLEDPAAATYIAELGQRLVAQIGGPPFPYAFTVIVDDPSPTHEVVALPGGNLFVPARLILAARDEDELAGMLAHGIAHAAARDETRAATRAQLMNASGAPLPSVPPGLQEPLAILQMKRRMELDADRLAAAKMADAGYDPAGLARYIQREQASYDEFSKAPFAPLPRTTQRVEAIRKVIDGLPAREYGPPHEGLAKIQDSVRRALGPAQ